MLFNQASYQKTSNLKISLQLLFLLTAFYQINSQTLTLNNVSVNSFNPVIGQTSELTFEFTPTAALNVGDILRFHWPTEITPTSTSLTCTNFFAGIQSNPCTYNTANNYADTTVTSASTFGVIKIDKFNNPLSSKPTSAFSITVFDSSNNQRAFYTDNLFVLTVTTPHAFASSSFVATATTPTVGNDGTVAVSVTTGVLLPANGQLVIKVPYWNPSSNTPVSLFIDPVICSAGAGANASLSCSLSSDKLTLTISNVVASDSAAGTSITVNLTNIKYSLSTGGTTGITVTSRTADGLYIIDQNSSLTMTGVTNPAAIQLIGTPIQVRNSNFVSQLGTAEFSFRIPVPILGTCSIQIIFPSTMSVQSSSTIVDVTYIIFPKPINQSNQPTKSLGQDRDIQLPQVCPITYQDAGQQARFFINDIRNPSSSKTSDSFQIIVKDASLNPICSISTGITYQAQFGAVNQLALSLTPNSVKATSVATISFKPIHTIPLNGRLDIIFPAQITPTARASGACSITAVTEVRVDATCQVVGQTLSITNPFFSDSTNIKIEFSINNIIGPQSTKPVSAMTVNTYLSATDTTTLIDTGTASSLFTATPGTMTQTSANPQANTDKTTFNFVTYKFSMEPQNSIPVNGYLKIDLPTTGNSLMIVSNAQKTICQSIAGFNSSISCQIDSTTSFRIINGLQNSAFTAGAGNKIEFRMNGIRNPRSFLKTDSFTFTSYDAAGFIIDQKNSGITTQMTIASSFPNANIATSSSVNANSPTTITFSFQAKSPVITGDVLYLTTPTQVGKPSTPTPCTVQSQSITGGCAVVGQQISVNLAFSVSSPNIAINQGSQFQVAIEGFTNPPTTQPSSSFVVSLRDASGNQISSYSGVLLVITSTPRIITTGSLTQLSDVTFTPTSYTFQFEALTPLSGSDYILRLQFPSTLILPTTSITCQGNLIADFSNSDCTKQGDHIINIANAFSTSSAGTGNNVRFTIDNITNSKLAADTQSITITVQKLVSGTKYQVDRVQDVLKAKANCNYPCFSCTSRTTAPSQCTSCNIAWSEKLLQGTSCVTACSQQWRELSSTVCEPCDAQCLECTTSKSLCSKCGLAAFPVWFANNCIASCDAQFYSKPDATRGNLCAACVDPCFTCTSAIQCTACSQAASNLKKLVQGTQCVETCTPDTFVQVGQICQPCNTSCKTCATQPDNCVTCNTGDLFLNNKCYSTCPEGYFANSSNTACDQCDNNCLACTTTATTCTKCTGALFLSNNQCIASCPDGTFGLSNVCENCISPCVNCTSASFCTLCTGGAFTYKGTCVGTCPANISIPSGTNCVECDSTCATCQNTTTQCTSCQGAQVLFNTLCYNSCPDGSTTVGTNTSVCQACSSACVLCNNAVDYCTKCSGNTYSYLGSCQTECPATNASGVSLVGINGVCQECNPNCLTCRISTTTCSSCLQGWVLQDNATCFNSAGCLAGQSYINGECVNQGSCPTDYAKDGFGTCQNLKEQNLVWFPFIICALVLFAVASISKLVNRDSLLISNFVMLMGVLEILLYLTLMAQGIIWGSTLIFVFALLAFISQIIVNLIWCSVCYKKRLRKDQAFEIWEDRFKQHARAILIVSTLLNLKIGRLLYSRFFGSDGFFAQFDKPKIFARAYNYVTWFNIVSSMALAILAGIMGFALVTWGFQLLMSCIQIVLIQILLIILIIIQMKSAKIYTAIPGEYGRLQPQKSLLSDGESRELLHMNLDPQTKSRQLRDILMHARFGKRDGGFSNLFTAYGQIDAQKSTKSLPEVPREEEEPYQRSHSYPCSPRTMKKNLDIFPQMSSWNIAVPQHLLPDNVIAKGEPPNPLPSNIIRINSGTQTHRSTIRAMKERGLYESTRNFLFRDDDDANISDDELEQIMEQSNQGMDDQDFMDQDYIDAQTGLIKKRRSVEPKNLQQAFEQGGQNAIFEQELGGVLMSKGSSGKLIKSGSGGEGFALEEGKYVEQEEDEATTVLKSDRNGAMLAQNVFNDVYQNFSQSEDQLSKIPEKRASIQGDLRVLFKPHTPQQSQNGDISAMLIPRDPQSLKKQEQIKKTFNFDTQDIRGVFDRDSRGNIVILRDPNDELIDKQGNRVNKRGYLIDEQGNVIDHDGKIVFKNNQLDSDDEIPGFYNIEQLDQYDQQQLINQELNENQDWKGQKRGSLVSLNRRGSQSGNDEDLIENQFQRFQQQEKDGVSANTSEAEDMGISPVEYDKQNRLHATPKPGTAGDGVKRPSLMSGLPMISPQHNGARTDSFHSRDPSFGLSQQQINSQYDQAVGPGDQLIEEYQNDDDDDEQNAREFNTIGTAEWASNKQSWNNIRLKPRKKKKIGKIVKTQILPRPSELQMAKAYGGAPKPRREVKKFVPYTNKGGTSSEALHKSASGSVKGFFFPQVQDYSKEKMQIADQISGFGDPMLYKSSSKPKRIGTTPLKKLATVSGVHSIKRPTTTITNQDLESQAQSRARLQEIKRDPQRDLSLLQVTHNIQKFRMERNQGTTDSDWDNFVGNNKSGHKPPRNKKFKKKKKSGLGQSTEKMTSIYQNMGDLVNNSQMDYHDNISMSQKSFQSIQSRRPRKLNPTDKRKINQLEGIYLPRLNADIQIRRGIGGMLTPSLQEKPITSASGMRGNQKRNKMFRNLQDRHEDEVESYLRSNVDNSVDSDFYGDKFERFDRKHGRMSNINNEEKGLFSGNRRLYQEGTSKSRMSGKNNDDNEPWAVRQNVPKEMTTIS